MKFSNLTMEKWNEEIKKYKECCTLASSCFEDGTISLFKAFNENESLLYIDNELKWITKKLKNSKYYKNAIDKITYEIDASCKHGYVDIKLVPGIEVSTFKSFLDYANTHI